MVESSTPDASTAVLSLVVDTDPDRVFALFTDPARLSAWFWPQKFSAIYETDPRPGGKFNFRSTTLRRNIGVRGIYGEVRRPDMVSFIWAWDGDFSPPSQVSVELRSHDDGTEIVLTHGQNQSEEERDNHLKGWHDCLSRLADHVGVR